MIQDFLSRLNELSAASPEMFVLVAFADLIMGVAPSSLPLFSVVIGYVAGQSATGSADVDAGQGPKGLWLSAGFVLGMATVDAGVGAAFGFAGYIVVQLLAEYLALTNLVLAGPLVFLGLALLKKVRLVLPVLRPVAQRTDSFGAAYALGIPFGLSSCPACTPMILPILGAAAATGNPWLGAALLFTFGLARGVPLLIAGATTGMAARMRGITGWVPVIERVGGVLLLVAAGYFIYQSAVYAGLVPPLQFLVDM